VHSTVLKFVGPFSILIERLQLLSGADTSIVQHLFRLSMNLLLCLSSLLDVLMVRIACAFNGFLYLLGPFSILIERLQLLSRDDTSIVQHFSRLSMNLLLCLSSLLDVLMVKIACTFNGLEICWAFFHLDRETSIAVHGFHKHRAALLRLSMNLLLCLSSLLDVLMVEIACAFDGFEICWAFFHLDQKQRADTGLVQHLHRAALV
jgi:hypothetical protein